MGERKKIVVEHFPVDRLPEELRRGLDAGTTARIIVEPEVKPSTSLPPLTSYLGAAQGVYTGPEDAVSAIRALRDDWE